MILGFVLKSAGTQAQPAETALPGPRLSIFGTIHPEIFRLSAPVGSESAGDRVRLASLEPQVGLFDAPAKAAPILTDTSAAACQNAPFEERFAAWMIIPRLSIVSLRPMIARPSTIGSGWPCGFFRARDCRRIRRSRTDQPMHRKRPFRTCTFASRNHAMRSHNHARRSLRLGKMAAQRSTISRRVLYTCRVAAGWRPILALAISWTILVMCT